MANCEGNQNVLAIPPNSAAINVFAAAAAGVWDWSAAMGCNWAGGAMLMEPEYE